jgi:hypothetical protein
MVDTTLEYGQHDGEVHFGWIPCLARFQGVPKWSSNEAGASNDTPGRIDTS